MIRNARIEDAAAIAAIVNPIIQDTAITFNSVTKTPRDVEDEIGTAAAFFVYDAGDSGLLGFVSAKQFRGGAGYARAFEHSIVLSPSARGRGVGRALMSAIEDALRERGAGSLWAGVSGENPDGVGFHQRIGFSHVATLPRVGWKFGRWMDLDLMVKRLDV